MEEVLTENKQTGYKSRILEASIVTDPERKIVYVDAEAAHVQIEK